MSSQINGNVSRTVNRIAGGVLALFAAVAVIDVSNLRAEEYDGEEDVIATTCGAGTLKNCGQQAMESCDWDISLNLNPSSGSFGFSIKRVNCKITGYVPIYKDNPKGSYVLSPSCTFLSPVSSYPGGAGCS